MHSCCSSSACFAISHRVWPVAWQVFYLSSRCSSAPATWLAAWHVRDGFYARNRASTRGRRRRHFSVRAGRTKARGAAVARAPRACSRPVGERTSDLTTWLQFGVAEMLVACGALVADRRSLARCHPVQPARAQCDAAPRCSIGSTSLGFRSLLAFRAASVPRPIARHAMVYALAALMFVVAAWRHPVSSARDAAVFAVMTAAVAIVGRSASRDAARHVSPCFSAWRSSRCRCIGSGRV